MPVDLSSLHGKAVLITGASRGIGAEAVRAFVGAGAQVGMVARDGAALDDLAKGNRRAADLLRHGQFRSRVASGCPDAGPIRRVGCVG